MGTFLVGVTVALDVVEVVGSKSGVKGGVLRWWLSLSNCASKFSDDCERKRTFGVDVSSKHDEYLEIFPTTGVHPDSSGSEERVRDSPQIWETGDTPL